MITNSLTVSYKRDPPQTRCELACPGSITYWITRDPGWITIRNSSFTLVKFGLFPPKSTLPNSTRPNQQHSARATALSVRNRTRSTSTHSNRTRPNSTRSISTPPNSTRLNSTPPNSTRPTALRPSALGPRALDPRALGPTAFVGLNSIRSTSTRPSSTRPSSTPSKTALGPQQHSAQQHSAQQRSTQLEWLCQRKVSPTDVFGDRCVGVRRQMCDSLVAELRLD